MQIPKIIHRTRLGNDQLPSEAAHFRATWEKHHPGWEIRDWSLQNLPPLRNRAAFDSCENTGYRSDILRYELLFLFGGVYVDLDFECQKPLDDLLTGVSAFAGTIAPRYRDLGEQTIETAILGSVAGHPFFERVISELPNWLNCWSWHPSIAVKTGPQYFQKQLQRWVVEQGKCPITLFRPELFYPYLWDEPHRRTEKNPLAYAVHHWWGTWRRSVPT
jgi:mannosyltransferase OCH1-like enzyme